MGPSAPPCHIGKFSDYSKDFYSREELQGMRQKIALVCAKRPNSRFLCTAWGVHGSSIRHFVAYHAKFLAFVPFSVSFITRFHPFPFRSRQAYNLIFKEIHQSVVLFHILTRYPQAFKCFINSALHAHNFGYPGRGKSLYYIVYIIYI